MIGMILAGGTGTRLWPYSRTMQPKQFLNLGNPDLSLIQQTYERLSSLLSSEKTFIIGSKSHEIDLHRQMTEIMGEFPTEHVLLEPQGRNTAPAILWGLASIPKELQDEPVLILPADHLIHDTEKFVERLKKGAELAKEGWIVTFGVKPDRPETGYGYIKAGEEIQTGFQVEKFVEKPDLATAEQYILDSKFSWNAGIFMATPNTLLKEFRSHCPEMYALFMDQETPRPEIATEEGIKQIFQEVKADSIDYAIMEKSAKVAVVTIDVGWNDLGSWESIYQISPKDENRNVTRGDVLLQDSKNCLVFSDKRLISGVGLDSLLIVETNDALLVCDLKRSQDIKQLVDTLKEQDREEFRNHSTVLRPWGSYTILLQSPGYKLKKIIVMPGKRISLQRHYHRSEHWVIVNGTAKVTNEKEQFFLSENQSTYIPKTALHRLENPGKIPLEIIEVQQGDYLGEDDIERFDDDYGRSGQNQ